MDEDLFVLDASVTINILGSGFEEQIFSTIPGGWVVVQNVSKETFRHPLDPSKTGDLLRTFVSRGLIRRVDIPGDAAMRYYELVGPPHDLDDGEASAIAVAEHFSGTLVIDEAKGRRVASSSPACRKILSSVDLFRHPEIAEALGSDLPEAIDSALKNSRMRVLLEDTAWVVKIIGREKAVMHVGLHKNMSKLGV